MCLCDVNRSIKRTRIKTSGLRPCFFLYGPLYFVTTMNLQKLKYFRKLQTCYYSQCCSTQSFASTIELETHCDLFEPGVFRDAANPFDGMPSAANHNHLLFQYARTNNNVQALKHFLGIRRLGLQVNGASFSCVLKICGSLCDQILSKQIHCDCINTWVC